MAYSTKLKFAWRVPIKALAIFSGSDSASPLEQFRKGNRHYYAKGRASMLGGHLGIAPQLICCWCYMVRPLALWEHHPEFHALVDTAIGNYKLNHCADIYRAATNYWPSPAWVFEKLLGPPIPPARGLARGSAP